jgi:hypothetical protein
MEFSECACAQVHTRLSAQASWPAGIASLLAALVTEMRWQFLHAIQLLLAVLCNKVFHACFNSL